MEEVLSTSPIPQDYINFFNHQLNASFNIPILVFWDMIPASICIFHLKLLSKQKKKLEWTEWI